MRVLMTVDGVGGVLSYAIALIGGLTELDPELEVLVAGLGPRLPSGARRRLSVAGAGDVVELGGALEWMDEPAAAIAASAEAFAALADAFGPDLIHANCHLAAAGPSGVSGPAAAGPPVLLAAHSDVGTWWRAVHGTAAPSSWDAYRRLVAEALSGAAAVVAPTRAHAAAVRTEYGLRRSIDVIHNGLAAPPTRTPEPTPTPFALAAARFDDAGKGLETLIDAAPELEHPLLVAGPLPPGRRAGERIGPVRLLGRLDPRTLARFRAQATVFVAAARYEPFGLAVLEAAQDGCALVLGDTATARELWDGAARFVPVGVPGAVAAELNRLMTPGGPAGSLGPQAQRRAERYDVRSMATAYLGTYRALHGQRTEVPA